MPKSRGLQVALLLGLGALIFMSSNLNWSRKNSWTSLISSDARGYFAYLPAVFMYQDPNFGFFEEMERGKYYNPRYFYDYRREAYGKYINKYFLGVAALSSPFYLMGHLWTLATGGEADGYSKAYIVFLHLGSIFYLALGMFFLLKLLQLYDIDPLHRTLTVLLLTFATNMSYYITEEPMMSHTFNFCFIGMFLYSIKKYLNEEKASQLLWASFFLGFVAILRPANLLVLGFIPFLAGSWQGFVKFLTGIKPLWWLSGLGIFFSIVFLQLGMYHWQTGHWWVYSYPDEGFNFARPHLWQSLFSYKKGLFVYTPVLFLVYLLGMWTLWHKNRYGAISWSIFFFVLAYILSSWSNWYYGGSFSYRPFMDYYACFGILAGLGLGHVKSRSKRILLYCTLFVFLVVNQIQSYQYRYQQIPYEGMTKETYWENFLRIDKIFREK